MGIDGNQWQGGKDDESIRALKRAWPASPSTPVAEVFPYDYIVQSTERSLRNLGVERSVQVLVSCRRAGQQIAVGDPLS